MCIRDRYMRCDLERIELPENAPFIEHTFMILRRVYLQKLKEYSRSRPFEERQALLRWFMREVDQGLLGWFSGEVRRSYYNSIYKRNFQLDDKINNPDYLKKDLGLTDLLSDFAHVLAEWSLYVELFKDLIDRAILYGMLPESEDNRRAIGTAKETWKKAKKFSWSSTSRKLFVKVISALCSGIKAKLYKAIIPSKEMLFTLGMVYFFVGFQAFPWSIVINRVTMGTMFGGFAGGKITDFAREFVERKDAKADIVKLMGVFEIINQNMSQAYLTLVEQLDSIAAIPNERDIPEAIVSLEKAIKTQLSERRLNTGIEIVVDGKLDETEMEAFISEHRRDGDLIIIDEIEVAQREVEHGFTLVTTT
eukprot:TRINITY_DN8167_c0_g1_i1.p1 TRINITY_DN8167_c0_g1~~TRINITY_DN8167_c0_g1_i1.p1  ORF type:complete len:364 (-),score=70.02 TRINITY_DN8167_c0_g1_i1:156-1247(-)